MTVKKLDAPTIAPTRSGRRPYDWDQWCDGNWYEVVLGQDVAATTTEGFRTTLHLQSSKRELGFEMRSEGEKVQFRFFKQQSGGEQPSVEIPSKHRS